MLHAVSELYIVKLQTDDACSGNSRPVQKIFTASQRQRFQQYSPSRCRTAMFLQHVIRPCLPATAALYGNHLLSEWRLGALPTTNTVVR